MADTLCAAKNSETWLLRSVLQKPPIDSTSSPPIQVVIWACTLGQFCCTYCQAASRVRRSLISSCTRLRESWFLTWRGERIIQSAHHQRLIAETRQGTKSLDAKLRVAAGLADSLQLIEECRISILRSNVERRSRQGRVNGCGVAQILLRDLPGIGDDFGITAEVAEETKERGTQQALIRRFAGDGRTQAGESWVKVFAHPRRELLVLFGRRGHLLIDNAQRARDGRDHRGAVVVTNGGSEIQKVPNRRDAGPGQSPLAAQKSNPLGRGKAGLYLA